MLVLLLVALVSLFVMSDPEVHSESLIIRHNIEKIAGSICSEVECQYNKVNGTLYAGSSALHFAGSYFFFDKKVTLSWNDIRKVQRSDHGVEIIMNNDEQVTHRFLNIHSPDRVWALLVSLHNDALMDRPPARRISTSLATPRGFKRRNSDPLMSSNIHLLDESILEEDDEEATIAARTTASQDVGSTFILSSALASSLDAQAVEAVAGKLALQPISCQFNKLNGKLYVGSAAVYFFGRQVFRDRKEILLKWQDIRKIIMVDRNKDENERKCVGLQLLTDTDTYRFLAISNADQVWTSLVSLHNEHLTANRRRPASSRSALIRMNSDPLLSPSSNYMDISSDEESVAPATATLQPATEEMNEISQALTKDEMVPEPMDDKEEWAQIVEDTSFRNKVVEKHILPCSLDKFFDTFLKDDAEFSIPKFLEGRGDSQLRASPWDACQRIIHYTHPVNAPMAPPKADARKEQRYRRYGDLGMCMWTKTFVEGVPMADCFFVHDRIYVEAMEGGQVAVNMEFDITFIKSTIFKGVISKTTSSEVSTIFRALAVYMSEALGQEVETVELVAEPPTATARLGSFRANISVLLLLCIVLLQIWILLDLRSIKARVQMLERNDATMVDQICRTESVPSTYTESL